MPRIASIVLLAGLTFACGSSEQAIPQPPRPSNLEDFDPQAVARILEAIAQVEEVPRQGKAWADLGMTYASERLKEMAIDCFRVASRLEPHQPKWPYREAVTLAQVGFLEEAVEAIERSLEIEPAYPPSHARLGDYRMALGDLDAASSAYRRATELDSSYQGGWVGQARLALQLDRANEAIEILERLLRNDPEDRMFLQLLANARQDEDGTVVSAEDILGLNQTPVWNDPWELEARAFRRKPDMLRIRKLLDGGQASEALAVLEEERARGAGPQEIGASFANAYKALGRMEDAIAEIDDLLALEPNHTAGLLIKAQIIEDAGDPLGALELLERVTTLQPTFGGAFAAKAQMLNTNGYHEAATIAFQRALELGEAGYDLRFSFGVSLIVLKRWPEARELFGELVVERPDHGDAWLELAIAQLRSGSLEDAEQALARARATGNASGRLLRDVELAQEAVRKRRANKGSEGEQE